VGAAIMDFVADLAARQRPSRVRRKVGCDY